MPTQTKRTFTGRLLGHLEKRKAAGTSRALVEGKTVAGDASRLEINGRVYINFCSNDYLGLSQHPLLKERSREYLYRYGAGSPSSRLLSGNLEAHQHVEDKLARLKGVESILLFSSGYQLNSTFLSSPIFRESTVLMDRLCHRSIIEGARMGKWRRFPHNDTGTLADLVGKQAGSDILIATESVFSMDGDIAPLEEIEAIAESSDAVLFVDEAHATGVFGNNGLGLMHANKDSAISMGTLGKGAGVFGAYIASTRLVRDYLINYCPGFIYTTALPPAVLGAVDAALDLIPAMEVEREQLQQSAAWLRDRLKSMGFDTGNSSTQIIPVITGDAESAGSLSEHLETKGFFARPVRPPTVAEGAARVRLSLTAAHRKPDIESLLEALSCWSPARSKGRA